MTWLEKEKCNNRRERCCDRQSNWQREKKGMNRTKKERYNEQMRGNLFPPSSLLQLLLSSPPPERAKASPLLQFFTHLCLGFLCSTVIVASDGGRNGICL
ncbi:hypothetical protein AAHE18_19G101600 [Arachis hypogaea]|uniref:Uncharacterized protein n=1 Tax=Arachis hypogaea TaxID=3818 RepID=A0A6B9VA41_ARAHY|nr:uncharacterized protein DS421_19g649970 [Arachis hypogaea]